MKPKTVPPVLKGVRRASVIALIIAVASAAAIGIYVLLTGNELDETTGKILLTAAFVAGFSATALCHLAVATRPVKLVGYIGIVASAVALVSALVLVWVDWARSSEAEQNWAKTAAVFALLAVLLAQVNLLLLLAARHHRVIQWALWITIACIAVVYGMILPPLMTDGDIPSESAADTYWRFFGVFAILDALGTVVLPVLGTVLRGREGDTRRLTVDIPLAVYSDLAQEAQSKNMHVEDVAAERLSETQ